MRINPPITTANLFFLFSRLHSSSDSLKNICRIAPFFSIGFFPGSQAETVPISHESKLSEEDLEKLLKIFQVKIEDKKNASFEAKQQACFEKVLEACKNKNWEKIEMCRDELRYLKNQSGQPLFLYSISSGKTKLTKLLIEKKIGLRSRDSDGNTALHLTAKNGNVELFGKLWEYIGIDAKNHEKQTPLQVAILSGQANMVSAIAANLKNLSSPFVWQFLEVTPLALAALRGEIKCVEALLEKVPLSNAKTSIGNILHLVVYFQQNEMLEFLLKEYFAECKAILDKRNAEWYTPLSLAVQVDNPQAVSLLHVREADIEAPDRKQRRPLHLAALSDNHFMIKCLVAANCEICPKDGDLKTPHHLAPKDSDTKAFLFNLEQQEEKYRDEKPQYRYKPPQNLIFKGGGPKGIAYIGALRVLENENALSEVKRVAGTSAGAITAALLAMNFPVKKIEKYLAKKPLKEFLDHNLSDEEFKAIEALLKKNPSFSLETTQSNWSKVIEVGSKTKELYKNPSFLNTFNAFVEVYQNYSQFHQIYDEIVKNYQEGKSLVEPAKALFKSLSNQPGICAGKDFEDWIEEKIFKGTQEHNCTFGELREKILQGEKLKHLHVFSVQLKGESQNLIQFNSEEEDWDDVVISSAIRASMSIPGIFTPAIIKRKKKGETTPSPDENFGSFIDGGVSYNFPIEVFDKKRYITQGLSKDEGECPIFNKRTLGFSLYSSDETHTHPESIQNIGQLLQGMISIFNSVEDLIRQRTPYNAHRVVEIDNMGVGLLDFDLDDEKKESLIKSGEKATQTFYDKQEGIQGQSFFNFPKLFMEVKGFHLKDVHPHFVGRKELLDEISMALSERPVLLHGPPGIGKSEVAITYANKHLSDYEFVFYLDAETSESLEQSYRKLARSLGLYIERSDYIEIRKKVHNTLELLKKNWLLLYDNLETTIPLPKGGGILITSRKKLSDLPQELYLKEVKPFAEEDAVQLLEKITGENLSPAMKELAAMVDCYPLVLGQIAYYIKRVEHLTISQYLKECRDEGIDYQRMSPQKRYEKTLEDIFTKLLPLLKPLEKKWLFICAYLSPETIPPYFLEQWLKSNHPKENVLITRDDILTTLSTDQVLLRYDLSTKTYSMHRLFQEILRDMDPGLSGDEARRLLVRLWEEIDFENINNWNKDYSIAEFSYLNTQNYMSKSSKIPEIDQIVFHLQTANFEFLQGKYQKALEKHKQALEIHQRSLNPNYPDIATSLNNIGVCFNSLGKYKEAMEKLEQALVIRQKSLESNHPDIARSFIYIGNCHSFQRELETALEKYQQARKIQQNSLEPNHPDIAWRLNDSGLCLYYQGKLEQAMKKLEKALKIRQKSLDLNHPDIATTQNNIGLCLHAQGKYKEALDKHKQALVIRQKSLKPNHPDIAQSLHNLGFCLLAQGEYKKALKKLEQVLQIGFKTVDLDHPDTSRTLNLIGHCLYFQGKYEEAFEKYQQALVIRQKSLKPNNPDIAMSQNYIGRYLYSQGKYEEALKKHKNALQIQHESIMNPNHPDIATTQNNIGLCLHSQGKIKEALEKHKQALEIQKKSLDPNHHPDIATTQNNIGLCLHSQGKIKEALEKHVQALEIQQKSLDPNHPDIAVSHNNVGLCLYSQGTYNEAVKKHERAYEIAKVSLGDEHPDTQRYLKNLRKANAWAVFYDFYKEG